MRFWLVTASLVCAAALVGAQAIPTSPGLLAERQAVAQQFDSHDPAKRAWGAFLAANYQLTEFAPEILKLATDPDSRLRLAAMDAAIRLDLNMADSILAQVSQTDVDPVVILIGRHPDRHLALAQELLARKVESPLWVAVNSILVANPPQWYTASLMRDWTIHFTIAVIDPGKGFAGYGVGGSCASGGPYTEPGFPPLARYYVHEHPNPGDVLLAAGPHPVAYRRSDGSGDCGSLPVAVDRDAYRRDYLLYIAQIGDTDPAGKLNLTPNIAWTDAQSYNAAAQQILSDTTAFVRNLQAHLLDKRSLTPLDASTAIPRLEVEVVDRRTRDRTPIPPVQWTLNFSR